MSSLVMSAGLVQLLLASCVCLLGFALTALLVHGDRKRVRLRLARVDSVVSPYRATRGRSGTHGVFGAGLEAATIMDSAVRLLRYDPARPQVYRARPLVVLILATIPALVLSRVLVNFVGGIGWAMAPVACVFLCRSFYGWCESRFQAILFNQFPDALAMIVRAVRVGLPVVEAIRVVARENPEPTAAEFAVLVSQTAIGVPLDEALREMAERNKLPEYRFFATALSLQSQTGGGLTETLENLADTIRKRVAAKIRGHALAAEARMSSYILGGLPIVTGGLLSIVNPDYMAVLFTDPSGRNLLFLGIALLGMGAFAMRMLIRKSLS